MKKNKLFLNMIQILSLTLTPIVFILSIIFSKANLVALVYILITCDILGDYFFLQKWHKEGITWFRKADKNFSKRITRKSADACLFIVIVKTLCVCIPYIFINLDKLNSNNIIAIILWIINIIGTILLVIITSKTNEKMLKIVPKKK